MPQEMFDVGRVDEARRRQPIAAGRTIIPDSPEPDRYVPFDEYAGDVAAPYDASMEAIQAYMDYED